MAVINYKNTTVANAMKAYRDNSNLLVLNSYYLGIFRMMDKNQLLYEKLKCFKMR